MRSVLAFAARTVDNAIAGFGPGIRDYPTFSPVKFYGRPEMTGVCTANLWTGQDPYTRLRLPRLTSDDVKARAAATAHLKRDPALLLEPVEILTP